LAEIFEKAAKKVSEENASTPRVLQLRGCLKVPSTRTWTTFQRFDTSQMTKTQTLMTKTRMHQLRG
jgi:hypothetical protein